MMINIIKKETKRILNNSKLIKEIELCDNEIGNYIISMDGQVEHLGPAIKTFYLNGRIKTEEFFYYGVRNDINFSYGKHKGKSAFMEYYENGNIKKMISYRDGKIHNEYNPAIIEFNENGDVIYEAFYLKGELIYHL